MPTAFIENSEYLFFYFCFSARNNNCIFVSYFNFNLVAFLDFIFNYL